MVQALCSRIAIFEELNTKRKEGKFVLYLVSLDSKESIQKISPVY